MRIYSSVREAVKEIERDMFEMGIDNHAPTVQDLDVRDNSDYDSKELISYGYIIRDFTDIDKIFEFFFKSEEADRVKMYCQKELLERMSLKPKNPGVAWVYRKEYWDKFIHGGKFSYTYSERMHDQFDKVLSELKNAPGSRQCLITIYDKHNDIDKLGGKERIPCSLYYHFMRRKVSGEDVLFMVYSMRSCDFYTHFPIDVWLAIEFGRMVATICGSKLISFTHFISSLHAFRKDYKERRIF